MTHNQCEMQVLVNGKPIKEYYHEGRNFIEARESQEYTIKLRNNTYDKLLGMVSVDGINVITGDQATENGSGYIVPAHSSIIIDGFRVSNDKVNSFIFSKKEASYSAHNEAVGCSTASCGVLGVKFVQRKVNYTYNTHNTYWYQMGNQPYKPPYSYDNGGNIVRSMGIGGQSAGGQTVYASCTSNPIQNSVNVNFCATVNDSVDFDMGTKFSDKEIESKVNIVDFDRGNLLCFLETYYASKKVLESMGIVFKKETSINFPESFTGNVYCKPPIKK